ncbi:MAG: CocE/NonD family hydrolase [Chloroflexi bacterium]|nr:CocE/NonD family hydrolase [Chloroflexota bacterium]
MAVRKMTLLSFDRDRSQYPYNSEPHSPEASEPIYEPGQMETVRIRMRDGVHIAADIYRPATRDRVPALCGFSPYQKLLQRSGVNLPNVEAGDTDFWVRRGYAHVVVDIRGSGESEGALSFFGEDDQKDGAEVVEWLAQQSWCNGSVGMAGMSYFAVSQYLIAAQQPPSLKAIFPYDGWTDLYREFRNTGGMQIDGLINQLTNSIAFCNLLPGCSMERADALLDWARVSLNHMHPEDGPYYWERSAWNKFDRIKIPTYMGSGWYCVGLHLRGAVMAWEKVQAQKRLLITGQLVAPRPWNSFHVEARRWYDQYLKGMDSGVNDGPPVNIFTLGVNEWRAHADWPLPNTRWTEMYLASDGSGNGKIVDARPSATSQQSFTADPDTPERFWGKPTLVYRTEAFDRDVEITGPMVLHLTGSADQPETHWVVKVYDEDEDGGTNCLTKGWLRGSHQEIDPELSQLYRPWHPHTRRVPLVPNEPTEFPIEIWPTSNVFKKWHRLRMEIGAFDSPALDFPFYHHPCSKVTSTVYEGGERGSRLMVPVIPS